jgi:MbtH protein
MADSLFESEDTQFEVVVNHEEQYSIWPADRELPAGWRKVGTQGKKAECLSYINEVWTDMRPLGLGNLGNLGNLGKKIGEQAT